MTSAPSSCAVEPHLPHGHVVRPSSTSLEHAEHVVLVDVSDEEQFDARRFERGETGSIFGEFAARPASISTVRKSAPSP